MNRYDGKVEDVIGKTFTKIDNNGDDLLFFTSEGEVWEMSHSQDCCECVSVEDIVGDFQDLIGSPIVMAEEVFDGETVRQQEYKDESFTWTFYKFATIKGYVTIRGYGSSNGYYSESVDFFRRS